MPGTFVAGSLAFYRDTLGLPLQEHPLDANWAEAHLDGIRFALHRTDARPLGSGTVRVDFEVEDVDEAADRVRAAGFEVPASSALLGPVCEVVDPDGYRIHVFEPPAAG